MLKHNNVIISSVEVQSWIVCDGDIDPEWIESLNSVLDDNRLLTMPSGERIQFGSNVNFIFETHDLSSASPATISRMGMIFLRWVCVITGKYYHRNVTYNNKRLRYFSPYNVALVVISVHSLLCLSVFSETCFSMPGCEDLHLSLSLFPSDFPFLLSSCIKVCPFSWDVQRMDYLLLFQSKRFLSWVWLVQDTFISLCICPRYSQYSVSAASKTLFTDLIVVHDSLQCIRIGSI